MKIRLFNFLFIALLFAGCHTLNAERVAVSDTSQLERTLCGKQEPSALLKSSDWTIATYFNAIHTAITNKDYNDVFAYAREIRAIYPQADCFSNLTFLEGYSFEQIGLADEAKKSYTRYLTLSSQTFSRLQRGYADADPNDSIYLEQRNAANQFVNGNRAMHVFDFPPIPPKYYVTPNLPGFLENECTRPDKRLSFGLSLGRDYLSDVSLGIRCTRSLSKTTQLVLQTDVSKNSIEGTLGLPLQLFRTENNNFGIKISPFLTYSYLFDSPLPSFTVSNQSNYVNGGLQVSAGYFVLPTVSVGGVYTHYLRDMPLEKNSYDLSLYWGLLENLSLKAGVKNKDIVVGCFLSGWEISWSLNHQRLILSSTLF